MTDQSFGPEAHQKLIDGLTVLVLTDQLDKAEALKIIAYYKEVHPDQGDLDDSILFAIQKDGGLNLDRELRYQLHSTEELEIRLGEVEYELAARKGADLPFRSFGDYQIEAKLNIDADYIRAELQRRS